MKWIGVGLVLGAGALLACAVWLDALEAARSRAWLKAHGIAPWR